MGRVLYSAAASDDLVDIADFIAQDKSDAARKWLDSVRAKCEMLARHPELGELRPNFGVAGCRSHSAGNYVIFYRAIDDGIEIARIMHASRDL